MATIGVRRGEGPRPGASRHSGSLRPGLLTCGILSSLLYAGMLAVVPVFWEGYSSASQTVSELSAIGAPTRSIWVPLGIVYTLLVAAFGWGVWLSARGSRPLRVVGALLIAYGLIGLFWPPMHLRGTVFTLTDTLHIVFAAVTGLLMLLAIGFGAAALGRRFGVYSIATITALVVFGLLTSLDAPRIAADLPTPRVGVWERINIGAFLLWIAVLAGILLRRERRAGSYGRDPDPGPGAPRPGSSSRSA
jgi:hypothetical protein